MTSTAVTELSQTHNRAVCVGILNIGSCNMSQITEHASMPADGRNLVTTLGAVLAVIVIGIIIGRAYGFAGVESDAIQ